MKDEIFNKTIANAKFDKGCCISNFGFDCKYNNSEISFGVNENETVEIEDFGTMQKGKWLQDEPTESQMSVMQKMIDDKIANWEYEREEIDAIDCEYEYCGVSKKDFY